MDIEDAGLSFNTLVAEGDERSRRLKAELNIRHRVAAPTYAPLPPGHRRTTHTVPIDGRMRSDNSIEWRQRFPPARLSQPYPQPHTSIAACYGASPYHGASPLHYAPSVPRLAAPAPVPIRHPLSNGVGFGLKARPATAKPASAEPLAARHAEMALASRYHQLMLQNRARSYHGPGLHGGPVMNVMPQAELVDHCHSQPYAVGHVQYQHGPGELHGDGAFEPALPSSGNYSNWHDWGDNHEPMLTKPRATEVFYNAPAAASLPPTVASPPPAAHPRPPTPPDYLETGEPPGFDPRWQRRGSALNTSMPPALALFLSAFDAAEADNEEHKWRRQRLFSSFDTNGNGLVSLAECGAGIMLSLSNVAGRDAMSLYHRFYRSYIRAFNDAKDSAVARPSHPEDDDYVTRSEVPLPTHRAAAVPEPIGLGEARAGRDWGDTATARALAC